MDISKLFSPAEVARAYIDAERQLDEAIIERDEADERVNTLTKLSETLEAWMLRIFAASPDCQAIGLDMGDKRETVLAYDGCNLHIAHPRSPSVLTRVPLAEPCAEFSDDYVVRDVPADLLGRNHLLHIHSDQAAS